MQPFLAEHTEIMVETRLWYWPGDVLVIWTSHRRLLVHRLIAAYPQTTGWRWMTQADAATAPDAAVTHGQILGRVQGLPIPWRWRWRAVWRGSQALWRRAVQKLRQP